MLLNKKKGRTNGLQIKRCSQSKERLLLNELPVTAKKWITDYDYYCYGYYDDNNELISGHGNKS